MSVLKDLFPPLKDDLRVLGPEVFGDGWKYRLAAHCEKRLAEAELKVQQLTRQPDGEIALQPFPTGTP